MNVSTIALWGRSWKLIVKTSSGNEITISRDAWDPEALRVTFDVLQSTLPSPYWYALVKVYNLNDETMQQVLLNAVWLTLEAGYQHEPHRGVIWDGPVLQVLFDRENVVDLTMTFNCIAGPTILENEFINQLVGPESSQTQAVSKMIDKTTGNFDKQVSPAAKALMDTKRYPRGKTLFGKTSKYFGQIADDNFLSHWVNGYQHYISEFDSGVKTKPDLVYGPRFPANFSLGAHDSVTRSVIGVPRQGPYGVIFTVLLDPRLIVKVPPLLVQLDNTIIRQQKAQMNQVFLPLDEDGFVIAGQVHHIGDTRGNSWYTEVTGFTRGYAQNFLKGLLGS